MVLNGMDARWPVEITGIEPISHLGSGGFGQVWLGNQVDLGRKVAVKISHIPFNTADDKRRFDRECRALGQLGGHPHIIEVHTSGESNGLPYLVVQYVDGGTLEEHGQSLTEAQLRTVMDQLCQAVAQAHRHGVLHRDLKPENIFLQKDRKVILGDFGIARLGDGNNTAAAGVTGSMAFVAPEVLQGQPPSIQADVYGVGISIVAATLGQSPFLVSGPANIHAIIQRVIEATTPDLTSSGLSVPFQTLLLRAMHPDPSQRPLTVNELRAELTKLPPLGAGFPPPSPQAQPTPGPQPPPATPPSPTAIGSPTGGSAARLLGIGAVGVIVLFVLFAGFSMLPSYGQQEKISSSSESPPDSIGEKSDTDSSSIPPDEATPTEKTTTTTAPPIPLFFPLNGPTISRLTGITLDGDGIDELLGPADNSEFCNDIPDITGMSDTLAGLYPADASDDAQFRQTAQRLHRFSNPDQASNFVATYTALTCDSWESDEFSSEGMTELKPQLVPIHETLGDETVSVEQVAQLPASGGITVELHSRTSLVRSGSDVYKLFYISLNKSDVDRSVAALLPAAIERLGY